MDAEMETLAGQPGVDNPSFPPLPPSPKRRSEPGGAHPDERSVTPFSSPARRQNKAAQSADQTEFHALPPPLPFRAVVRNIPPLFYLCWAWCSGTMIYALMSGHGITSPPAHPTLVLGVLSVMVPTLAAAALAPYYRRFLRDSRDRFGPVIRGAKFGYYVTTSAAILAANAVHSDLFPKAFLTFTPYDALPHADVLHTVFSTAFAAWFVMSIADAVRIYDLVRRGVVLDTHTKVMGFHHAFTMTLIFIAHPVALPAGVYTVLLCDSSDVMVSVFKLAHIAKLYGAKHSHVGEALFGAMFSVWLYTRMYRLPMDIGVALWTLPGDKVDSWVLHATRFTLFHFLMGMNAWWTLLMAKLACGKLSLRDGVQTMQKDMRHV